MEKFMKYVVNRRWLMATLFAIICLFGIYSWKQLPIDAYPDIADVTVHVVTQVPGLAAEEIEQQITIPLERELNGTPSLHTMRSSNAFGLSIIVMVFEDGTDDYWARQRVAERIAAVELPYDAQPELNPLTSPTGEIFRYILTSKTHSLRELTDLNKWIIIPRLRQISGIADVSNFGGITTQFQIEINPDKLNKYDLSLADVTESIEQNNSNAGGSVLNRGDQSYVVRGVGLVRNLEDMGKIVVKTVNGVPVYLNDLGTLKYGNLERKGVLGYVDDKVSIDDGVEGIVQILRYENPTEVLKNIHQAVEELNNDILPAGVQIQTVLDRTDLVETTLHTVSHTLFFGMILVIIVLMVFLGSARSAFIVAITIPISLLIAFILMHFTNVPANLLSLGAIDFGILVDGAIVMTETILKKRESNPDAPLEQEDILHRILEVAKPIFFSLVIIIVAYMPLFAFERIEKKLFTPMAFTVGYALLGALAVALILIPGLAFAIYQRPQKVYRNTWMEWLTQRYRHQTERIMEHPRKVFLPIGLILTLVVVLGILVGKDFLPALDEGGIWIQVQTPPGISLEKSTQMATEFRHKLKEFDEVTYVMTQVGRDDEGAEAFTSSHIECSVGLKPYSTWKRGRRKGDLVAEMAAKIDSMPGYTVGFSQPIIDMVMDQIAGSHSDLAVKVYGENQDEIRRIAEEIVEVTKGLEGATDVVVDQEPPLPQLQISANRDKIAQYGLNVADVAELIEVAIGGKAVSQVFIDGKVYDVICRYNDASRDTPEKIGALMLTSGSGAKVPLSAVAEIKTGMGMSTISREMNKRHLTVRLNLRGGRDLTSFLEEANQKIAEKVKYDHTLYQIRWDGQLENQRRAYSRLAVVIPFTLALMYLLLLGAFGKFRQAGLLIALLPLALVGGLLALNVRGMSFNVSSAVGFIALFGLTINNGVLMISHINTLRERGKALKECVVSGATHRLRPILMTATVAILGLLPASLSTDIGSDVQRPLSTVIVYGLLFSTAITLFVLPATYYLMENHHDIKKSKRSQTMKAFPLLFIPLLLLPSPTKAQDLSLEAFLGQVKEKNIAYLAEKYNVDIAEANLQAARVFPDPELSLSYSNNQDPTLQMGQNYEGELSYTFSLGGVRKARIGASQAEKALAEASLVDFFQRLKMEASTAYLEALKQQHTADILKSSYEQTAQLAQSDSIRFSLGEGSETDAIQSRLEAQIQYNEYLQAEAEYKNALTQLFLLMGENGTEPPSRSLSEPVGKEAVYDLGQLLQNAEANRSDLMMALHNHTLSEKNLRLVKANRALELGVSLGLAHNTVVRNEIAPAPRHNSVTVGLSVPLKFSNRNKGEIRAAQAAIEQSEAELESVRQQIRSEVVQSHRNYLTTKQVVDLFSTQSMKDAAAILKNKTFAYQQGEASLLEVLDAQRTYNDVALSYQEALYNAEVAKVELERTTGMGGH